MTQIKKIFPYLISVLAAFVVVGILLWILKFNPFKAYETLLFTSFRTPNGFIQTILNGSRLRSPHSRSRFPYHPVSSILAQRSDARRRYRRCRRWHPFQRLPAGILLPLVILAEHSPELSGG